MIDASLVAHLNRLGSLLDGDLDTKAKSLVAEEIHRIGAEIIDQSGALHLETVYELIDPDCQNNIRTQWAGIAAWGDAG